jgi:zinc transport system substrate-binding protein
MRYTNIRLLLILLFLCSPLIAEAAPRVVVTIKPVHALVSSVMQGIAEPQLMIKGSHSPHTFTLKPSQMHQLENADIIFWVGEVLETALEKTLQHAAETQHIIELIEAPGLKLLGSRSDLQWGQQNKEPEQGHHHHGSIDPHIWLSPFNASVLVQYISVTLAQFDPDNATQYQVNAQRTLKRIQQLDQRLKQQLAPVEQKAFVVFHDAYQHFEQHYHLNAIAAVTLSPERLPGARRIKEIQQRIKARNVRCVFNETQFKSRLVNSISEGSNVRISSLDPLGASLPAGPDAWFELMQNIGDAISTCLTSNNE